MTAVEPNMMSEVVLVVAIQVVCSIDMFGLNTCLVLVVVRDRFLVPMSPGCSRFDHRQQSGGDILQ